MILSEMVHGKLRDHSLIEFLSNSWSCTIRYQSYNTHLPFHTFHQSDGLKSITSGCQNQKLELDRLHVYTEAAPTRAGAGAEEG